MIWEKIQFDKSEIIRNSTFHSMSGSQTFEIFEIAIHKSQQINSRIQVHNSWIAILQQTAQLGIKKEVNLKRE